MAITSISSTNEGIDTSDPTYAVSVSIPTPGTGASTDTICVLVQWWGPREYQGTGVPGAGVPTVLGDTAAGLTEYDSNFTPFDTVSDQHSSGHILYLATRSAFMGGSLTLTKPTVDGTIDPTEFWVAITTIVVDGTPTGTTRSVAEDGLSSPTVATGSPYDVVFFTDHYVGTGQTFTTIGSYAEQLDRILGGAAVIPHRLGIVDATDPTTAAEWSSTLGFSIVGQAFEAAPPVVTRGRRGLGLIHAPRIG